jgi:hypothetical protein
MTETTGFADEETQELQPRKPKMRKSVYVVRRMTESGADPAVFSHEDQGVARHHIETNYPRGREVYLQHPDGYQEHFSAEHKAQGNENGGWFPLDEEEG